METEDTYLRRELQRMIGKSSPETRTILHNLYECGHRHVDYLTLRRGKPSNTQGVFVVSNGISSKIYGILNCNNSWACPYCSPNNMSKHAAKIAIAMDAIKYHKNQIPIFMTFTVPHSRSMSYEDVYHLLKNTWHYFTRHGKNGDSHAYHQKDGYNRSARHNVWSDFCNEFNVKYYVRVAETTYGQSGWHPHYHMLIWVDSDKYDLTSGWEESIREAWLTIAKRKLATWFKAHNYPDNAVEHFMANTREKINGFYISKNPKTGKVAIAQSSQYICGWGADKEVTGNYQHKASNDGHYSMRQLLESAVAGNTEHEKLYLEYACTMVKLRTRRIQWSRSDYMEIIRQWKMTHEYKQLLKKKLNVPPMTVVFWFTSAQWSLICEWDYYLPMISNILYLAKLPDATQQIAYYVRLFGIEPEVWTPAVISQIDKVNEHFCRQYKIIGIDI